MKNLILPVIALFLFSCKKQENPKAEVKEVVEQPAKTDSVNNKFNCYDGSQTEMNACAAKELKHFDSIMNVKYNAIITILDAKVKEDANNVALKNSFVDSQKKWFDFKASNRNVYEKYYSDGSMRPLATDTQSINDTKDRIKFLEIFEEEINK